MFDHKLLEKLRKQSKKTHHQIISELKELHYYNISVPTLWRFETGRSSPQVKDLKVLAKYYKVDMNVFFKKENAACHNKINTKRIII